MKYANQNSAKQKNGYNNYKGNDQKFNNSTNNEQGKSLVTIGKFFFLLEHEKQKFKLKMRLFIKNKTSKIKYILIEQKILFRNPF